MKKKSNICLICNKNKLIKDKSFKCDCINKKMCSTCYVTHRFNGCHDKLIIIGTKRKILQKAIDNVKKSNRIIDESTLNKMVSKHGIELSYSGLLIPVEEVEKIIEELIK